MKMKKSWLVVLAAVAALTSAHTVRGITFGEPDGTAHSNVGGIMITWPDGFRFAFSSGTLVYKGLDSQGKWTGVVLTAGHSTDQIQAGIDSGEITGDYVTVNFAPDANSPEHDLRVVGIHTLLIERPNFADWDDAGILILQVDDPADLPEPAACAPVGFLDQFTQQQLQDIEFVAVGYGASLLFPPAEIVYENRRQFSTPEYLNLLARSVLFQANGRAGNPGVASGDSGGPLFWTDPQTGVEWIVGIAHGVPNYSFMSVEWHYRTDTAIVHDFIREVIDGL